MGRLIEELIADANLARNDLRRQGDELRPLGKKASRTRLELLDAASACFLANGYRATSVEDIHEAAAVSIGTFYQYFRDKADVMTTLVAEAIIDSASRMFPNVPLVDDDAPRGALEGFVKNYARTADFQAVWEEATHFEARLADFRHRVAHVVEAGLAEQIIEGQQSGAVADTLDPLETARALAAMVDRYCYLTFVVDGVRDRDSVRRTTDLVATLWQNALQLRDRAST